MKRTGLHEKIFLLLADGCERNCNDIHRDLNFAYSLIGV
jgi:hypothetical protein